MTGWQQLLQAAAEPLSAFEAVLLDPERAQIDVLMRILRANADCEFGRAHDFTAIRTVADYRSAVPVRVYADFESQINRMAYGEAGVLTSGPVIAFEETGGTSSGSKLIPYTDECLASFGNAVLPWLAELARRRPGICAGKTYVSISPATRQQRETMGGIPVGLGSEAAYLGNDLVGAFLSILAVPSEVAAISDVSDWRLETLTALIECEDLTFVSVWSPTFFLALIEAIPAQEVTLVLKLSAAARARMAAFLHNGAKDSSLLWPRLDTVSCWNDGSSAHFAARLASLCPQAQIEPKGLFSTEAALTLPWGGKAGCVPALTSTFTEFVDKHGKPHLAHELDEGAQYRGVITTPGGLYRYDMGDRVRCIGHEGDVARLVFEGRTGMTSDMVGEKLTEAFVATALSALPCAAALFPKSVPKPHYELWLDETANDPARAALVETALCRNPQYAYARKIGQLGALVPVLKAGFVTERHLAKIHAGKRLGDMKHASLILD